MPANDASGGMTLLFLLRRGCTKGFASNYPSRFTNEILSCWLYSPVNCYSWTPTLVLLVSYSMHLITCLQATN